MKPRYYVHMGPRAAENVSSIWKAVHITVFFMILVASGIATYCIYEILDIYDFHCIIYAKVSFEQSYEQRLKEINKLTSTTTPANDTNATDITTGARAARDIVLDCAEDWDFYQKQSLNDTGNYSMLFNINNTGFLNMRKTVFATDYMCDLLWFSPLTSVIMSIFLGVLIAVGGKGGAGNPGDLLPNPWICVYPFLSFCVFMLIFSCISANIYTNGLEGFCAHYYPYTGNKGCTKDMDQFNVQFTPGKKGPPRQFYWLYMFGNYGVQFTAIIWAIQTLVYILRIFCLADFSLYLTRIRLKEDEKADPKMASVVMRMMDSDSKSKRV